MTGRVMLVVLDMHLMLQNANLWKINTNVQLYASGQL